MIKTLQNTLKQDREGFVLPKSVQDAIPIRRLWPDGIFQFGSKFSKTIRFSDINYAIASKEDKTSMFLGYSELLNALDTGSTTKLTINNKRLNRQDFEQKILLPRQNDYLDGYRAEYNAMLMDKVTDSSNSVVQERYITLSVHRKSVEEARTFFDRVTADVTTRLSHLDARSEELDAVERLRVLHDFYRTGEETEYHLDLRDLMRKGHSFKDTICPDSLEFKKDHFVMGDKFGRVLFLKEYASYIKDSMISELTALNRTMMLSIDVIPVPTDEAVREMQNRLLGVETNVTNWQRRQNSNNNFSAVVPYDLEQQRKETREMLDDLTTRDQRMMFAVVTLVHLADSKEELDSDTDALQSAARKHLCQLATLNWQQADGLVTALPLGLRRIDALRTLTTEALAVLIPFKAQEVRDQGGVYYGQNVISKNLIIANRKELLNGNGFVLGVSGSGKSFTAKREMVNLALSWDMTKITTAETEVEYPAEGETEAWTEKVLTITVTPRTPDDMRVFYAFTDQQNAALDELLTTGSRDMWNNLLYGSSGEIVAVALSQVGNVGGQPYWSWYGFNSRVEWCACFVSWCANECGYIDAGVIPKFAGCTGGSNWFKDRGQWQDGGYEPHPGDLIFFDWDEKGSSGPQDDVPDHVGIVERVENGVVYTVEGNSGDSCRQRSYNVGHYEIWGYGCPIYN